MTSEEKRIMMEEIMKVVDKHVAMSNDETNNHETNSYGKTNDRTYRGISEREMAKWKEEYKRMRVEGKTILEDVLRNPIDTSKLTSSFDIFAHYSMIK